MIIIDHTIQPLDYNTPLSSTIQCIHLPIRCSTRGSRIISSVFEGVDRLNKQKKKNTREKQPRTPGQLFSGSGALHLVLFLYIIISKAKEEVELETGWLIGQRNRHRESIKRRRSAGINARS